MSTLTPALRRPATWPRRRPEPTDERLAAAERALATAANSAPAGSFARRLALRKLDQAIGEVCTRAGLDLQIPAMQPWRHP